MSTIFWRGEIGFGAVVVCRRQRPKGEAKPNIRYVRTYVLHPNFQTKLEIESESNSPMNGELASVH